MFHVNSLRFKQIDYYTFSQIEIGFLLKQKSCLTNK